MQCYWGSAVHIRHLLWLADFGAALQPIKLKWNTRFRHTQKRPEVIGALLIYRLSLLEQRLAGQAVLLQDLTQALEPFYLDLPHPFPGQANLQANILQGAAFMPAQTKATYHHFPLLVGQLPQPLVDALRQVVIL